MQQLLSSADVPGGADRDGDAATRGGVSPERDAGVGTAGVVQQAESGEDRRGDPHFLDGLHGRVWQTWNGRNKTSDKGSPKGHPHGSASLNIPQSHSDKQKTKHVCFVPVPS